MTYKEKTDYSLDDSNGVESSSLHEIRPIEKDDFEEIEEGYEIPTEEEMQTLRRVTGPIPFRCWLIALVELAERFSYYGLSTPFQNYMSNGPNDRPAGVLQLKSSGATGLSYFFQFWCYVTPIMGGYVADTYIGKYNTIAAGTAIYLVGMFILFMTSIPSITTKNAATGGFIVSIILIGIATGMIKANLSVMIADQIEKHKPRVKTTKKGERVIEDNNITIQNVFLWFYLMINIGSLSVIATSELELHIGFWAAYLLPFCFFWVGVITLIVGRNQYILTPVGDKAISKAFRIFFMAIRNRFNFDVAVPSKNPEKNFPWSDKFVEEVKRALSACKVFLFYPIYWTVYGQMISSFVTQGAMVELHGLPNDFFQCIDSIALMIFVPICERFLYPFIRRFTPFRPITKIFYGFMFCSASMVYSCVFQYFIYKTGPSFDQPLETHVPNHVHVALQVPAYVFIALSEIFASVTGLEYAYSKGPTSMKSFIMGIFLFTNAVGAAIGCALSPVSKDPYYTWLFCGLAVASFVAGWLFWLCFKSYNDTEEEENALDYDFDATMFKKVEHSEDEEDDVIQVITHRSKKEDDVEI